MTRKLNSYMVFVKDVRSKVVSENPNLKVTEVAKKLGEMWRNLSSEEKNKYENKNVQSVKTYTVSPRTKKSTSYINFVKKERANIVKEHPSYTFAEIGKELGLRWKSLTLNEKCKYT